MLVTSVSLPKFYAKIWRENQAVIMFAARRAMRIALRCGNFERGKTRSYNSTKGEFSIVTSRFTEKEYDRLHFLAASLRVSVSSLVFKLIQFWLKPSRKKGPARNATNYSANVVQWDKNGVVVLENLICSPLPPPGLEERSN